MIGRFRMLAIGATEYGVDIQSARLNVNQTDFISCDSRTNIQIPPPDLMATQIPVSRGCASELKRIAWLKSCVQLEFHHRVTRKR